LNTIRRTNVMTFDSAIEHILELIAFVNKNRQLIV
jgi:hypothetical protein